MSYPVLDSVHVTEGVAHLTDHYRNKIVVPGVMKAFLASVQELENVFWDIINKFLLVNSPTGDQLRQIGQLVGAQYHGESDTDYLQLVKIQIRVNRSQGTSEDIIQIARLWLGAPAPTYLDFGPPFVDNQLFYSGFVYPPSPQFITSKPQYYNGVSFLLEALDVTNPLGVASSLSHARSLGTRGVMHYSTWAAGNDMVLTSAYGGKIATGGVLDSVYDPGIGGLILAQVNL